MGIKTITIVSPSSTKVKILISLFLIGFCIPGVMAQTVSFAQPDTLTQKDIYLYAANGTLLGLYNTTSTGITLPADTDIIFTIKPQYSMPLDEPATFLASVVAWLQTNVLSLVIIGALGALLFKRF